MMTTGRTITSVAFRTLQEVTPFCGGHEAHAAPIDPNAPPQPIERWLSLLEHLATAHFGELPRAQALEAIGGRAYSVQLAGSAGTLLRGMLDQGPERFLVRASALSRHFVNFGDWAVTPLGPGHLRCGVDGTPIPGDYYAGYFRAVFAELGTSAEIRVENGGDGLTLDIHYQPVARG